MAGAPVVARVCTEDSSNCLLDNVVAANLL